MSDTIDDEVLHRAVERIDSLLSDCIKIVDKSQFGEVYELNYNLGRIQSIIEEFSGDDFFQEEYLKKIREEISHLKAQSYEISLIKNPSDIERRKLASDVYLKFSERVPNNFRTTNRYVLIAAATTLVSCIGAIGHSWQNDEFVRILAYPIYYNFIPSLIFAALSEVVQNSFDAQHWSIWGTLTGIHSDGNVKVRKKHELYARIHSVVSTVLLSSAVAILIIGMYRIADGVLLAKKMPRLL